MIQTGVYLFTIGFNFIIKCFDCYLIQIYLRVVLKTLYVIVYGLGTLKVNRLESQINLNVLESMKTKGHG
jgi:hypothetical protein